MKSETLPIQKWLARGLSLVIIFTLISTGFMLLHSSAWNLKIDFSRLNYLALGLACLALLVSWIAEGGRIKVIAAGLGEKITLAKVLGINLAAACTANITPFYSGGIPTQIYLLCRNGIQPGKSSAIVTLRLIISTLIFTLFAPFLLLFYHTKFSFGIARQITAVAIPLAFLGSALMIFFIINPKLLGNFFAFLIGLFKNHRFSQKIKSRLERLLEEIETFHQSIKDFRNGIHFYIAFLLSILYWISFFSIAPLLIYTFGASGPGVFLETILLQFILVFIVAYIPIPSGSGVMELGLYSVFIFVPSLQLRTIIILIWRFLSYHVATFVGGVILIKQIHSPRLARAGEVGD
ncbi:MAG: flippase-like domain-containing protein [Firmicutes bacterium]|nr:flippase-like domain-containing protein [Bacillota bacterium]